MREVRDTFSADNGRPWNISLSAMASYLHASSAVGDLARVLVVVAALVITWKIWSRPQSEPGTHAIWLTAPLFVILILCFSFAWGYYTLLLLPLGFAALTDDRLSSWVTRIGVVLAIIPPILVYTVPGYPERYYNETIDTIFHLGIVLNGASVVGVLLALAGTALYAWQDAPTLTARSGLAARATAAS